MSTNYDLPELFKTRNIYRTKFSALARVERNNKVGIDAENNLYVEFFHNGHIQAWIRSFKGQSRIHVTNYIKTEFIEYSKFLLYLIFLKETYSTDSIIQNIIDAEISFVNDIIPGISNLKTSYPEYNPIITVCDDNIKRLEEFSEIGKLA